MRKFSNYLNIFLVCATITSTYGGLQAQSDSLHRKLTFNGDFRFRVEPDWNSRRPDGTYREDRTRLRYRMRFGANFQYNQWASFGMRIRTGIPDKQQDPQLTLGEAFKEFGTLPIGFEKIFFDANYKGINLWVGKNTFPFEKRNELFWSDNVFPEGIAIKWKPSFLKNLQLNTGHFIVIFNNGPLSNDSYFQGIQLVGNFFERIKIFPAFYYFNKMPNIPDGAGTFNIDYSIVHLGTSVRVWDKPRVLIELDYYHNIQDLARNDSIPRDFVKEKIGWVPSISIGKLEKKGDLFFRFTWMNLERYSAVDFLAQNDWARWDYSAFDSLDGRLTNYTGIELMFGYAIAKKLIFSTRYFHVDQLVAFGRFKENGSRIRFDIDIAF